jgi:hypothetical protein
VAADFEFGHVPSKIQSAKEAIREKNMGLLRSVVMSWSLYDTKLSFIACLGIPYIHGKFDFEELHGFMPVDLG